MIKKFVKLGGLMVALLFMFTNVQAQKFGYVNSAALLAEMPDVKQMQSNLEGLKTQLEKKAKQMLDDFQAKQRDAAQKQEAGQLSPVQQETLLKELQASEQEIIKYQSESQQKLIEKEQELLKPIQDKIMNAINEIAKTDGYQYVFDGSTGVILFADDATNITDKVKAKLGI